ncbi:MAG: hypothetical protein ACO3P8_11770 [Steroidobacteraceae bacterium]
MSTSRSGLKFACLLPLMLLGCTAEPVSEGHRSPGKPRPPVQVRLAEAPNLQAGVPARLRLHWMLPEGAMGASIEFDDSEAIQVTGVAMGAGGQLEAAVMPMIDGPQVLSGFISFRVDGSVQGSPFRLGLPAGRGLNPAASVPEPAGVLSEDARDGMVMSLAAETTSR